MKTTAGHLTYCTNIHPGESWADYFDAIKRYIPEIKSRLVPDQNFGIGLRLSSNAAEQLRDPETLAYFRQWLSREHCYVFTINGFPLGNIHQRVKDGVHSPDWTTKERVTYTIRMFGILSALIPRGIDGGISTSPLSYKPWLAGDRNKIDEAINIATRNLLQVLEWLVAQRKMTGQILHLDIEPEPDGLLENSNEFINWYKNRLIPAGIPLLQNRFNIPRKTALDLIRSHICLCYDVCHFAIEYENAQNVLNRLGKEKIRVGKVQLSAAIKACLTQDLQQRREIADELQAFDEDTYLHQVIGRRKDDTLCRYPDLSDALNNISDMDITEWRAHFHVPLFMDDFGLLTSTRDVVSEVMHLQLSQPFTNHLEVETYTWKVLPADVRANVEDLLARELEWVTEQMPIAYPY